MNEIRERLAAIPDRRPTKTGSDGRAHPVGKKPSGDFTRALESSARNSMTHGEGSTARNRRKRRAKALAK